MSETGQFLWAIIEPMLFDFAQRIGRSNPSVRYALGCSSNEVFIARGYVAFSRFDVDDEISVVIDAALLDGQVALSADACMENGQILANGPQVTLPSSALILNERHFTEWLTCMNDFLASIEGEVRKRLLVVR